MNKNTVRRFAAKAVCRISMAVIGVFMIPAGILFGIVYFLGKGMSVIADKISGE